MLCETWSKPESAISLTGSNISSGAEVSNISLPDSHSPELTLSYPSLDECTTIWTHTSASWIDSLTLPLYLKESKFLTTVPLAKDGGMTIWILVNKNLPPGKRQVLCSCETFRKRSLTSDSEGNVRENIFRGHGYPQRMMRELSKELFTWQTNGTPCTYYAKLGWHPNASNSHVEFQPQSNPKSSLVADVLMKDLAKLCKRDEMLVRQAMATPTTEANLRVTIIPDIDHMGWHLAKEDFACDYLFGKIPQVKGAIVGSPGSQVWALWTHRYYGRHDVEPSDNVLYILRLVMETDRTATRLPSDANQRLPEEKYQEQMQYLKAVLEAAQTEAFDWKLDVVKLWDPTPQVQDMLAQSGMEYEVVEREEDSIASGYWYDETGGVNESVPLWVNNEHYAWL
ncbi:hypothetical protein GQ43DRAFT_454110 [Delitschia confertaspora ATCC 74209]|uniref:LYC1 C-terminal domain-containing protein n=1 Tax=Delitschia confertaspora ATCC 74209 TaxID=1513339 RepID=A0A9P4MSB3_9PLEO|nr:hypothetical protein GQ43DRAFT_454110 [Delitschia confertaspora ATCC 74209]